LTSITSRPFTGQLGSAEQNSDITLAAGLGINMSRGTGIVRASCENNSHTLQLTTLNEASPRGLKCDSLNVDGAADFDQNITQSSTKTFNGVKIATFNALNIV